MVKHLQMLHAILRTDTDIQRKQYTGVLYNRNIPCILGNHTWVWDFSITEWLDCSSLKKQILKTVRNKLLRKKTLNSSCQQLQLSFSEYYLSQLLIYDFSFPCNFHFDSITVIIRHTTVEQWQQKNMKQKEYIHVHSTENTHVSVTRQLFRSAVTNANVTCRHFHSKSN